MKLILKKGVTSQTALIFVQDSSVTTGVGLTGLAFNTAGLSWYYYREGAGTGGTSVTLATATLGTWTSGGFVAVDGTNLPGWYEIGIPNAALATGADFVGMQLKGATNMAPVNLEIELVDVDLADGVRMGLTALPNANADAAGGLPISDAGGLDLDTLNSNVSDILVDTSEIGAAGAGLTEAGGTGDQFSAIPWNASWDAEVQSEVNDGLVALGLDHLVSAAVTGTDVTDNSIVAKLVSSSATADWDTYVNTTDALQAIRDRGDAAWTTGGGGSISDIVNWQFLVPPAIDLANTKSYRLAIAVTNALDDLPTTAEITPGTISIDRAANAGTSWTSVVSDAACSELDGVIYYDEVFDTATGYAAGDMLRITFKGQLVTVSANDYVICPSGGHILYSGIINTLPDVNVSAISGSSSAADALELFALAVDQGTGQLDAGSFTADAITASIIQDGAFTSAKFADAFLTAAKIATDAIGSDEIAATAVTEIQSGLATAAALATVDSNVDAVLVDTGTTLPALFGTPAGLDFAADIAAIKTTADAVETDTQDIQSRLPASLNNGAIQADIQRINDVAVVGDGSATPFTV